MFGLTTNTGLARAVFGLFFFQGMAEMGRKPLSVSAFTISFLVSRS
jgi:hypothetical protein